jgi:DNA transformation protein
VSAEIRSLRGLGPRSQAMLGAAGITTLAQLESFGAVRAFLKVKASGAAPTLNLLWGLESALTNEPWQDVARVHRARLLLELDALERGTG